MFFFPPNSTSIHQPLDQGIISTIKVGYKMKMLTKLITARDKIEQRAEALARAKRGRKGLKFGHPATVRDASKIMRKYAVFFSYCIINS